MFLAFHFLEYHFFFNHLKIFKVFTLVKLISAHNPPGIIRLILSDKPPPVIFAQPFNKLFLIKFNISFT